MADQPNLCARCEGAVATCESVRAQYARNSESITVQWACTGCMFAIRSACLDAGHARKDAELAVEALRQSFAMKERHAARMLMDRLADRLEGHDAD